MNKLAKNRAKAFTIAFASLVFIAISATSNSIPCVADAVPCEEYVWNGSGCSTG